MRSRLIGQIETLEIAITDLRLGHATSRFGMFVAGATVGMESRAL
jgi:hypothetical protein